MNLKLILYMSLMFIFTPMWIGYIWIEVLRVEGRVNRMLHAWVLGFATMLAVSQLVLVPMVAMSRKLSEAQTVWNLCMELLALLSFWLLLTGNGSKIFKKQEIADIPQKTKGTGRKTFYRTVFGVIAGIMILMQAYIPARYEHSDDDDSRFIAEEVSAVVHDSMYQDSPIDADIMYWNVGEVRKDLTSPWAMFVAMQSSMSGVAPAIISHSYLPFFLILLCYGLYALIGRWLFDGDWEKVFIFLIFLSMVNLFGYTSTHTMASMLLLRIWQGKAVCASFTLPLLFYLFGQIMRQDYKKGWLAFLYVASTGACLLSGIGIVTAPVVLLIYGFLDFCYHREWKKTFAIWAAALPCAIYLAYYLFGYR